MHPQLRSIYSLDILLRDATVLIGQNNAGKSAILDAVRVALARRWGQRGSGFTEHDIYQRCLMQRPGSQQRMPLAFAGLVTIGAMATVMYELFSWVEKRTTGWAHRGTQGQ